MDLDLEIACEGEIGGLPTEFSTLGRSEGTDLTLSIGRVTRERRDCGGLFVSLCRLLSDTNDFRSVPFSDFLFPSGGESIIMIPPDREESQSDLMVGCGQWRLQSGLLEDVGSMMFQISIKVKGRKIQRIMCDDELGLYMPTQFRNRQYKPIVASLLSR